MGIKPLDDATPRGYRQSFDDLALQIKCADYTAIDSMDIRIVLSAVCSSSFAGA